MSLTPTEKKHSRAKGTTQKIRLSKKKKLSQIVLMKVSAGLPLSEREKAVWVTLKALNEEGGEGGE